MNSDLKRFLIGVSKIILTYAITWVIGIIIGGYNEYPWYYPLLVLFLVSILITVVEVKLLDYKKGDK